MEKLRKKIQILLNLYKSKKLVEAENFANNLINENPNVVFLYNVLGLILTDQRKLEDAIKCYENGIKIDPKYAMIYNNLGTIYKFKENYRKAESYYKKSIVLNSKIPEPLNNLGNLYDLLNKNKERMIYYKKAVNVNPKFFVAHYNLGLAYKSIGKFEDAKKHLKEAVKLNPYFYTAHRNLSLLIKYKKEDEHFRILKKMYEDLDGDNLNKTELSFALGKAYEDIKDFKKSFRYYHEGNNFRRKVINFSMNDVKVEFNYIKKVFNKKLFIDYKKSGHLDGSAIFIVGMPRSGTTLVEQILSSHPRVFGGDELNILPDIIEKNLYKKDEFFFKNLNLIDKENLLKFGQEYIKKIKTLSNESERITDKLPINFKLIGFIKLILPNSKIIHCIRNPKDNCFSIFKNYFVNKNLNYAYNLNEITGYFNLYNDLMSYWKNILNDFIFDIQYEKIIENPEYHIKNLLKQCDLTWNKNCLKFYENERVIKTSSDSQVRKKFYKTSINSWKNFKSDLENPFQKLPI